MSKANLLKFGKFISLGLAGLSSVLNAVLPTKDKTGDLAAQGWWLVGLTILMTILAIVLQAVEVVNDRDKQQKALIESLEEQKLLYGELERVRNPIPITDFVVQLSFCLDLTDPRCVQLLETLDEGCDEHGELFIGHKAPEKEFLQFLLSRSGVLEAYLPGNDHYSLAMSDAQISFESQKRFGSTGSFCTRDDRSLTVTRGFPGRLNHSSIGMTSVTDFLKSTLIIRLYSVHLFDDEKEDEWPVTVVKARLAFLHKGTIESVSCKPLKDKGHYFVQLSERMLRKYER